MVAGAAQARQGEEEPAARAQNKKTRIFSREIRVQLGAPRWGRGATGLVSASA